MLLENERLYQRALKLHKTRNIIVHRGEILEEKEIYKIGSVGARDAISTVNELFKWYGTQITYFIPTDINFVKLPINN